MSVYTPRFQYTFKTTAMKFARLTTLNVKTGAIPVNIVGYSLLQRKKLLVKIVVGVEAITTLEDVRQNNIQHAQFEKNMQSMGIKYKIQSCIQIRYPGNTKVAGIFRIYYTALVCAGVPILASYIDTSYIMQIPETYIAMAMYVLNTLVVETPFNEAQLCINANNA